MAFISGAFTYLIIFCSVWCITFFIALPIGVQQEAAPMQGQDHGAPANPNIKKKAIYSAAAAAAISAVLYVIFEVLF